MKTVVGIVVSVLVVSALALWLLQTASSPVESVASSSPLGAADSAAAAAPSSSGSLSSGRLGAAPPSSARAANDAAAGSPSVVDALPDSPLGRLPTVAGDANPQVASVAEALKTGAHPERLSVMAAPTAFDADAYARDPAAYLNVVEPGRAFQPAPSDADVPVLEPVGQMIHTLVQGEQIVLEVRALPGAPVSWHALGMGDVGNGLTSTTVQADETGLARITYTATSGTKGPADVMVASPLTRGVVNFALHITLPNDEVSAADVVDPN